MLETTGLPAAYCVEHFKRVAIARFGRCLRTFFGSGTLPTACPLIAYRTFAVLVKFDFLAGAFWYERLSTTISVTTGTDT
jgi:hypothetical protein